MTGVVCILIITILLGQSVSNQSMIAIKQGQATFKYLTETCSALFGILDFIVLVKLPVQHRQANCNIFQLAISALYIVFTLMEYGSLTKEDWQRF